MKKYFLFSIFILAVVLLADSVELSNTLIRSAGFTGLSNYSRLGSLNNNSLVLTNLGFNVNLETNDVIIEINGTNYNVSAPDLSSYALKTNTVSINNIDNYEFYTGIGDYPFTTTWVISNYVTQIDSVVGTINLSTEELAVRIKNNDSGTTLGIHNDDSEKLGYIIAFDNKYNVEGSYYFPYNTDNKYLALTSNTNGVPDIDLSIYALDTNVVHASYDNGIYGINADTLNIVKDYGEAIDLITIDPTSSSISIYGESTDFNFAIDPDGIRIRDEYQYSYPTNSGYFILTDNAAGKINYSEIIDTPDLSNYITNIIINDTRAEVSNNVANIELNTLIADESGEVYSRVIGEANLLFKQSNITSGYFHLLVYGNGKYIAGSSNGIYYSTDGVTWTQSNITSGDFSSLLYSNGKYIAGSYNTGGLYYSSDGVTWTQSNITSGSFHSLTYGNGLYLAGSYYNMGLYYSSNGVTWTQSNITSGSFLSLTYSNDKFIAGSSKNGIYYSSDGITWTQSNITSESFLSVTYANGMYLAGSSGNMGIYYSSDGVTWTQSNQNSGYFVSLTYSNDKFIAGSSKNGIYYSSDGVTWTQSNITSGIFISLTYSNDKFIAGSNGNGIYYADALFTDKPLATKEYVDNKVLYKNIAMFILPVNNDLTWNIFTDFELKASTNNFDVSVSEEIKLQYYAQSEIANVGSSTGTVIDKMWLFTETSNIPNDIRRYKYITNTINYTNILNSVVVLVDISCLKRHDENNGEWLSENNEEIIWCYCRYNSTASEKIPEYEYGTDEQLWRPIAPVKWFSKMPSWASDQIQ